MTLFPAAMPPRSRRVQAAIALVVLGLAYAGCGGSDRRSADAARPAPGHGGSRAFFVAPDGSDRNPGTRRRPFRTLGRGLRRLHAGSRLYVRGGVYRERIKISVHAARPRARVLVSNFPGERPIVEGQLWIGNPSYWTIRGIDVTWAEGDPNEPMARIYGGTGWKLTGSEIWGAHSTSGLHIDDGPRSNLGRWAVVGNCIHDTHPTNGPNQDHNIYVDDMSESPSPRGLIERNVLFGAPNGRGIKLGPGVETGGAVNVTVRFNTIFDSAQNIGVSRDSSRVHIYRNILAQATDANVVGFRLNGHDNVVRNNLVGGAPRFIENTGGRHPLTDDGGNRRRLAPGFDPMGCRGLVADAGPYGATG